MCSTVNAYILQVMLVGNEWDSIQNLSYIDQISSIYFSFNKFPQEIGKNVPGVPHYSYSFQQ